MGKKNRATPEVSATVDLNKVHWVRHAHNYLMQKKAGTYQVDELNLLNEYMQSLLAEAGKEQKTYKIGLMFIAINPPYWQYAKQVIDGVKQFFAPGHETEILLFTDMQNYPEAKDVNYGATVFPVETMEWPYPTLMRYHYFLKQEEYLKKFDYLFYLDLDTRVVGIVGDEIFGEGLTVAPHPGYAIRQNLWAPLEANPHSAAFIKQPGRIIDGGGKPLFAPFYCAGGFQGGRSALFIDAMKEMQRTIDADLDKGYIARWNDESHWNKYIFEHQEDTPITYLDVSYVYPDSMIEDYYVKLWGRNYTPRLMTITKPFSLIKDDGSNYKNLTNNL